MSRKVKAEYEGLMTGNVLRLYEWASEVWFEGHLES